MKNFGKMGAMARFSAGCTVTNTEEKSNDPIELPTLFSLLFHLLLSKLAVRTVGAFLGVKKLSK
jgi:hypothetical protein